MPNEDTSGQLSRLDADDCYVGVIFALGIESAGLEDLLHGLTATKGHGFAVKQGAIAGRRVAVAISGAGRDRAARAAEALLAGHRPRWVVSAGFAGGLDENLRRGDILLVDQVIDEQNNVIPIDLSEVQKTVAELGNLRVGRLLTCDRVVRSPGEKRALGRQYGALAVDMETYATAALCRDRGARLLALRAISDALDDELPPDMELLLAQKTNAARFGAALGAILRRPGSVKDMLKMRENALVASDRLAKYIVELIEKLGRVS
jgi:adenosylhomocysteine nucleosidase